MDCGGWQGTGLTPLSRALAASEQSSVFVRIKAVSRPTCHRNPKSAVTVRSPPVMKAGIVFSSFEHWDFFRH
jgi:hypothetical protein